MIAIGRFRPQMDILIYSFLELDLLILIFNIHSKTVNVFNNMQVYMRKY